MVRSTIARVDLGALRHNFTTIQAFLEQGAREIGVAPPAVLAVVKANAYGHGAAPVAQALEQAGATMLACADIEEGIVLRRAGVRVPILVFGALSVSDLRSEEHTSELQSQSNLVCRLLLEKKKKTYYQITIKLIT